MSLDDSFQSKEIVSIPDFASLDDSFQSKEIAPIHGFASLNDSFQDQDVDSRSDIFADFAESGSLFSIDTEEEEKLPVYSYEEQPNGEKRFYKLTNDDRKEYCSLPNEGEIKIKFPSLKYFVGTTVDNFKKGYGRLKLENGRTIYVGEFENCEPHGKGKIKYPNGDEYEGEVEYGKVHGKGKIKYSTGDEYEGEFEYGKPLHGKGKIKYPNGDEYEGEVEYGKPHGKGKLKYSDGREYEGEVKNGKPHGKGKIKYFDGREYEGEFENGLEHKKGKLKYPNGDEYEGEFENGLEHGKGKIKYSTGDEYEGEFEYGKLHGKGKLEGSVGKYYGYWYCGRFKEGTIDFESGTKVKVKDFFPIEIVRGKGSIKHSNAYEINVCVDNLTGFKFVLDRIDRYYDCKIISFHEEDSNLSKIFADVQKKIDEEGVRQVKLVLQIHGGDEKLKTIAINKEYLDKIFSNLRAILLKNKNIKLYIKNIACPGSIKFDCNDNDGKDNPESEIIDKFSDLGSDRVFYAKSLQDYEDVLNDMITGKNESLSGTKFGYWHLKDKKLVEYTGTHEEAKRAKNDAFKKVEKISESEKKEQLKTNNVPKIDKNIDKHKKDVKYLDERFMENRQKNNTFLSVSAVNNKKPSLFKFNGQWMQHKGH